MPKLKTNRGAAKRFRRTGSGGFKRRQGFRNHILTKKSAKRIRQLRRDGLLEKGDAYAAGEAMKRHLASTVSGIDLERLYPSDYLTIE